ncbi:Glycosyltransferase, catalytic subunit of cellulose synthase and poly-beta-1,6-N-acetylglucosamine synthase [Cnuella takakiae]|uniref:Glycosyltransferase, catalytic subunit of cellulose synthase and poly-beta-1,6-N-acetylglucosamine synthase n=1 Tax=Cnuella takakiae TaxID=1302690 RepID=A0A1M5CJJ7_9BACT|nr:glycosyltransferase family 2 protein [Cnuella takakiae]OLY91850.1 glycosyl transferase [Cnuella takakiae]SHF54871.1 Glycosyltransferase, catalytic subunit of cellulose synthase and poly-beta-1,6-N-acetylglucosamine synthase [Cnuella takakiae]
MTKLFWISILLLFYTFLGYGIVLYILVKIKQAIKGKQKRAIFNNELPSLTLVVAAYNEELFITEKIKNTLALNYPQNKLHLIFITDGSTDRTPDLVQQFPGIQLLHTPERKGKISAVHRAMNCVKSEIVVFTDANTLLNTEALVLLAQHFSNQKIGAVAGEKRVMITERSDATAGEGFYWRYESLLKKFDAELYSVIGAAGELYAIRTDLYEPAPLNSIIDDFIISLSIARKGFKVAYEPNAYALETASANSKEELKRKVRIAAGGIQSIIWLKDLMNPIRFPILSFQFISHRVLRWTLAPFALILAFTMNILIVTINPATHFYYLILAGQSIFYLFALLGWVLEQKEIKVKTFFIPYYFCLMNYAVLAGIHRYFSGKQSAAWEKSMRK